MAAETQDQQRKQGVFASLKGAWRKVAGTRAGRSDSTGAATAKPADLPTTFDAARTTGSAPTVPASTDEAPQTAVSERTATESTSTDATAPASPATETAAEPSRTGATDSEPTPEVTTAPEPPAALEGAGVEETTDVDVQAVVEAIAEPQPEPVSEPLDVATDQPVKPAAKAKKAPKPVAAQDASLEDSAPGLSASAAAGTAAPKATATKSAATKTAATKSAAPKSDTTKSTARKTPSVKNTSPFIAPASTEAGPDSSWTVAQLRSLAKERGVRGYSSMSKPQLLGALSSPQA